MLLIVRCFLVTLLVLIFLLFVISIGCNQNIRISSNEKRQVVLRVCYQKNLFLKIYNTKLLMLESRDRILVSRHCGHIYPGLTLLELFHEDDIFFFFNIPFQSMCAMIVETSPNVRSNVPVPFPPWSERPHRKAIKQERRKIMANQ